MANSVDCSTSCGRVLSTTILCIRFRRLIWFPWQLHDPINSVSCVIFPYRLSGFHIGKKTRIEASLSAVRIRINFNQSCTAFKADMSIEILNSITCIVLHSEPIEWTTISSWYLGSSNPLYFDMLCRHSKPHRFKLIVESDLSEASLHVINLNPLLIISMTYIFKVTGFARIPLSPAGLK